MSSLLAARNSGARRGYLLGLAFLLLLVAFACAPRSAHALPPSCDPDCDPGGGGSGTTIEHTTRTLTVSVTGVTGGGTAAVTSSPAGISCNGTCSMQVDVTRECINALCGDWDSPNVTLTGPALNTVSAGKVASWTGCDSDDGHVCTVAMGGNRTVEYQWVAAPLFSLTLTSASKVGPSSAPATASASGGTPPYSYVWKAGGQTVATGPSLSFGLFATGYWGIRVEATDVNGVTMIASKTVIVDRSTFAGASSVPTYWNAAGGPTISLTHDGDASLMCKVNTGAPQACTATFTPAPAAVAADGSYTVTIVATDDVGNTASVTRSFIVDRTAPVFAATSGPSAGQTISATDAVLGFAVTDANPGTTSCAVDSGAFGACTSGTAFAVSGLAQGAHTLHVRSTDAAGNSATLDRAFSVDTLPPVVTITGSPAAGGSTTSPSADLTVAADEGALSCTLDGVFAACGGHYGNRGVGDHELVVTAVDALGHSSVTRYAWTVVAPLKITKPVTPKAVAVPSAAAARLTSSVRLNAAARISERLTIVQVRRVRTRHGTRIIRRTILVGTGSAHTNRAGAVRVVARLNRTGRVLLARSHRLVVKVTMTVTTSAPRQTVRSVTRTTIRLVPRRTRHRR
jgi:hypothetical protein